MPRTPPAPGQPSPRPDLGFDTEGVADRALAFVRAVRESGWFRPADLWADWPPAGCVPWQAVGSLAGPLADWERAMNPRRLPVDEFDRMDRLRGLAADAPWTPLGENTAFAAMVLAAGLVWAVRFLHAEPVWGGGAWSPRPPYGLLPEGLINLVGRAAHGLRAGGGYSFAPVAGEVRPAKVGLADAAREAHGVVGAAADIRRNLTERPGRQPDPDYELFHLFDRLEWHCARLPRLDYEPCYPDRAWHDGGVSGTCAHTAAVVVREAAFLALGGAAWSARAAAAGGDWPAVPWPFPFWTPAARVAAAERFPTFDLNLWDAQLEIERTRLVRAAPVPTGHALPQPIDPHARGLGSGRELAPETADRPRYDVENRFLQAGTYEKRFRASATRARRLLEQFEKRGWEGRVPSFQVGGDVGTLARDMNDKHLGPDCPIQIDTTHVGLYFVWRWKAAEQQGVQSPE